MKGDSDDLRQFLVMRDADGRLRSILVFEQGDPEALAAYGEAEGRGVECCLFGADSIGTLCKTHPNWMDEPVRWADEALERYLTLDPRRGGGDE